MPWCHGGAPSRSVPPGWLSGLTPKLAIPDAVDGIDGPLARRYDVTQNAPLFDGVLLDLNGA